MCSCHKLVRAHAVSVWDWQRLSPTAGCGFSLWSSLEPAPHLHSPTFSTSQKIAAFAGEPDLSGLVGAKVQPLWEPGIDSVLPGGGWRGGVSCAAASSGGVCALSGFARHSGAYALERLAESCCGAVVKVWCIWYRRLLVEQRPAVELPAQVEFAL